MLFTRQSLQTIYQRKTQVRQKLGLQMGEDSAGRLAYLVYFTIVLLNQVVNLCFFCKNDVLSSCFAVIFLRK